MIDPNLIVPATPTSTPVSTPTPNDAEGAVGGADAASQAAEALEKEIEWKQEKKKQNKTIDNSKWIAFNWKENTDLNEERNRRVLFLWKKK